MSGVGSFINQLAPGSFAADGAYAAFAPTPPQTPLGPNQSTLAIVGAFTDGPKGVPIYANGNSQILASVGSGTTIAFSGVREALSALPETQSFVFIRDTDGTDTNATISVLDTNTTPGTILTLTAVNTGSNANNASARVDLQSGTLTASPVLKVTVSYPNQAPVVYAGIVAYATQGGAYAPATFKANAIAAINGTAPNSVASTTFVASAGSSTTNPSLGVNFPGTGGTDGASGLTTAQLLGVDGSGSRTGIYALRGVQFGGLIIAGCTDPTIAQPISTFLSQVGGIGFVAAPSGTSTNSAISAKAANNIALDRIVYCQDWEYVNDTASGNSNLLVSPMGAIASIILSHAAYLSPSNKPRRGKQGVLGTERTRTQPVDPLSEGALRQQNGIMWLTNQMPRGGGLYGLPHPKASSGANIQDVRMKDFIGFGVLQILGQYVGEMQGPVPPAGTPDYDTTRRSVEGALRGFLDTLLQQKQIAGYAVVADGSNNSTTTVQQGILRTDDTVTLLSGVEFALANLIVGNTVPLPTSTAPSTALNV